ncbi:MAG: lamin tail domain-containing protein [bacterium]|nr:lamin tail domain-containing protein [bacterium]
MVKIILFLLLLLLFPVDSKSAALPSVSLNEILPSPQGQDAKEEWIEIFNTENDSVDLTGWQITDTKGSIKTFIFPKGSQIAGQSFLLLKRPQTKITLNNDADGLQLIYEGIILDSVEYIKSATGQSFNRTPSGWAWSATLTPGSKNIITAVEAKTPGQKKEPEKILTQGKESAASDAQKKIANISNQIPEIKFPPLSLNILLFSLGLAIFSGIIMLFVKKKLNK